MKNCILVLITFISILAMGPGMAQAATINVTANAPDAPVSDGQCSLREAITSINTAAAVVDCPAVTTPNPFGTNDTINLPAGTYTTTTGAVGAGEHLNANGDLDITAPVAISGAGPATTIVDGGALEHVFHTSGIAPGSTVSISGVTIRNGNGWGGGGGIWHASGSLILTNVVVSSNTASVGGSGGGVYNSFATMTITNSTISGNTSPGGIGGGIYNGFGTMTITDSTISGNDVPGGSGGGINSDGTLTINTSTVNGNSASTGGGITSFGPLTVTNSTISGNTATNQIPPALAGITPLILVPRTFDGGGIYLGLGEFIGSLNITNSTISGNSATTAGGGIFKEVLQFGTVNVNLKNTIVANQLAGGDCNTAVTTTLNDLDSDGTCGVLTTANPLLGPLANNGGATFTHALLAGSPAIDTGDVATCAAVPVNNLDQRGVPRPQGPGCDIGSFELVVAAPPPPPPPPPSACTRRAKTHLPRLAISIKRRRSI